jgi:hypothetical protein
MAEMVLSDFVDIAHASGIPKASKIAEVKHRGPYEPSHDFYKRLRDQVEAVHARDLPKLRIRDVLEGLRDRKKVKNYPEIVQAYMKWWGRKQLRWQKPPRGLFSEAGVDVVVNPDVGFVLEGVPYYLKLYFKNQPLNRSRVALATHLMELSLRSKVPPDAILGFLDVRRGRIIPASTPTSAVSACLHAEIAYIASVWPNV